MRVKTHDPVCFFSLRHTLNRTAMKTDLILIGAFLCIMPGCEEENAKSARTFSYAFTNDAQGWIGDFADYPIGQSDAYDLQVDHATLPPPLDTSEGAVMMSGSNQSDDLFMFLKKEVTGLSPGAVYSITFTVEFASNVADGQAGIGGAPGESVFVKAGASQVEPAKLASDDDYYRMNIDKGNQSQGGQDMTVIGDFSNDSDQNTYRLVTRTNENPFQARADSNGGLWLIIGTDSGFEGTTTIYYNQIDVVLR